MGSVYLAEHPFMGRKAAIKVLRREFAEDPGLVERFMNEARAANAIRHPNIIDIIDVGRMPSGIPYLMMEFLEGESLAQRLIRGTLSIPEAVDVILQTAGALAAAHSKGIVHRDLKPDNLYLVPDESAPTGARVKVLDFGIAKLRGDMSAGMAKTQAGSLMGTPPYMSPEQCRGVSEDIDQRTDVYAMGIILYEMLCGGPPFMAAGWGEVVLAHLTKPPASPRSRNPAIPESIEVVILKALAKPPDERFQSAAEMRAALRAMSSSVSTFPPRPTGTLPASPTLVGGAPAKQPTTFRTATGEMAGLETMAEGPGGLRRPRRAKALIAGVAAAGILGVIGAILATGGRTASVAPPAPVATATSAAPAARANPMPAAKPMAALPREAPRPAQILVRLASEPAGALVMDAKRGVVIGATPFEQHVDRRAGALALRLAKDGYASLDVDVPLGGDFEKMVRLEPRKEKARSSSHASSSPPSGARKLAVAKSSVSASGSASVPTAPPQAAPAAPPAAKPKAEKW